MKKALLSILIIVLGINLTLASEKAANAVSKADIPSGKIIGKVVDKLTGEGLTGVEISLIGTDIKVYTDFEGNFKIKDVQGAQAIKLNYISYEETVENVYSYSDKEKENKIVIKLNNVNR